MMKIKHTFFSEDTSVNELPSIEANHALRVLRMQVDDLFYLIDGKGTNLTCKISRIEGKRLIYDILREEKIEYNGPKVAIGIALPKSKDRINVFLEKTAEIGIHQIIPLVSKNSERQNFKRDKMQHTLISALKQSGNYYLPEVLEPQNFEVFVKNVDEEKEKFIAHCEEDGDKQELKSVYKSGKNALILIGPEGDFTSEELILAKENGFIPVSLGNSRLRTETAGIVACHTFHVLY
ncbi:MAG: 16S rRNA (uracil(1498)-N(3))-methyltransferase [Crocinitomicaceae bacterium]|nr:16S rRNA (uracil(1498)-N(3))-methyltransferase [Crocinitomicaceae bacterium]